MDMDKLRVVMMVMGVIVWCVLTVYLSNVAPPPNGLLGLWQG